MLTTRKPQHRLFSCGHRLFYQYRPVLLWAMLFSGVFFSALSQGHAGNKENGRIFDVATEKEFAAIVNGTPLRGGDVLVLSLPDLKGIYNLHQIREKDPAPGKSKNPARRHEPVYIVGRAFFSHVLERFALTRPDIRQQPEARRFLSGLTVLEGRLQDRKKNSRPGTVLDTKWLTALSLQKLRFLNKKWSVSGFDIKGHTDKHIQFHVRKAAHLSFTHNRISNCDKAFENCLWQGRTDKGKKRNGGILIHVDSTTAGTVIRNNLFEYLRGFLLIRISNDAVATQVTDNSFTHMRKWGPNGAEAIHIGYVPVVSSQTEEPRLSTTNTVVARNYFFSNRAEGELVGVKSKGNRIVGNWIVDSTGISLRDGSDTLVEGNVIIRSYGIRVMGDRQIVRNNYIVLPVRGRAIWFENGAPRAGYECRKTGNTVTTAIWRTVEPLRWLYRAARNPVVTGNRIEVRPGGKKLAIAPWTIKKYYKKCGFDRCDGNLASRVPCDRQIPGKELAKILHPSAGNIITVPGDDRLKHHAQKNRLPFDTGW